MRLRLVLAALFVSGCVRSSVPDPRDAAKQYAEAASKGDADAIYDMMSDGARKSRTREEVRKIVADEREELALVGKAIGAKDARVEATARLRYEDGEETALDLKDGRFWVTAAGALPGGARTPEEALDQLRRVIARRSYAGLMRVLSPQTRAAIEQDLRSLVTGLDHPETLGVQVSGDSAQVTVPGGHHVHLVRDGGIWRIDDFD